MNIESKLTKPVPTSKGARPEKLDINEQEICQPMSYITYVLKTILKDLQSHVVRKQAAFEIENDGMFVADM